MIYKTLKKVSDYCQLLDKSKYTATQTKKGITFTNNGDGTITANGTAVGGYSVFPVQNLITVIAGHKYLISTGPTSQLGIQLYTKGNKVFAPHDIYNVPQIITCIVTYNQVQYEIVFNNGVTVSGAILKPQLFDLTEMYGAGNEPTTVEEFRTKFPNELYDYKPYCFVKSYKNCLTCTTKNLFDISKVPTISGSLIVKDNSICSYDYPVVTNDTNLLSIFKSLKPNTNYTMSATTLNYLGAATNYIVLIFSNANDDKIIFYNYSAGFNKVTFSLTQEQINNITYVYFYGRNESSGGPIIWSNIQLEEGSTASEYQPYGYIQSRKKSLKVSNSILL